ncbi:MAG TPA: diaminopimelate decarboxylase, partial [Candidatus Berkiella sp.]|nr:diaminopimelate decarboxylase [Candidatus Berkiella sp.]
MNYFNYRAGELWVEEVPVQQIIATLGTPCYIYSHSALLTAWQDFRDALGDYPHQICYAVKANSHLAILNSLATVGSGFDIVSGGELARVIAAGGNT